MERTRDNQNTFVVSAVWRTCWLFLYSHVLNKTAKVDEVDNKSASMKAKELFPMERIVF